MKTRTLPVENWKTSTVELRELLNGTERGRLLDHLSAKRGVRGAGFSARDPRRLRFDYDADLVSVLGILVFLENCALHARLTPRDG